MDEPWLSELLERATAGEPPIGPVARNSLLAGIRRRRRRRVQGGAACAAAVAVICAAVLAVTGASGTPAATGTIPQTVYVLSANGTVTPISTATNTPGQPIAAGPAQFMALTPNGQTLYVADGNDTVTPIATATNTPGKPIKVGQDPGQILVTPDGQTAYVAEYNGVTPISTATNTPEKPITGVEPGGAGNPNVMAITPDGKTLYVASGNEVIPVSTATNTPGKPILFADAVNATFSDQITITPDGSTLYVINSNGVITPVSTATNTPGKPIPGVAPPSVAMAMTPDGNTFYVAAGTSEQDVVPISTATNTPGKPINVAGFAFDIAVTPDGQTAYVASRPRCPLFAGGRILTTCPGPGEVTPISTATNTPGTPVKVTGSDFFVDIGGSLAITPDGKTIYIISRVGASGDDSTVTPITTATNTPGQPVKVAGAQSIVIAP
jgi:DNA-binding beta-propeller fold protein YncE